ncbi:Ig-like domain-containing protein [Bradyrhizobium sp. A5]|uniref:Ig-like domain-containing protein n=1 Tax=Bradyrhizobium sp. A5 TaxID=3133696 RepID=UPI003253AEAE
MAIQAPTIEQFSADSGTRGDGVTDSNVVTLWGKAAANSTVTIYDGTTRLGTVTTNSSGSWAFTTPKLADSTHSLAATATDASGTSAASAAMSIKVVPSVTKFVSGTDNWSNPSVIDGQGWYSENAGQSWSLTTPDSHTVRMELRAGDYWADGGNSSRSEILAANSVANGDVFNATYQMTIEPGTSNVNSGLSWLSLTQMYGANGATFSIQLKGEQMAVVVNLNEATEKQVYIDPNSIQRGHAYSIQIQARFASDSTGYLEMWRDGVQIVNYHGVLGDPGANYNLKLGIYRGEPTAANYTMAADYSNIVTSTDPNFPTPPFGGAGTGQTPTPPTAPTISSFSNDSNIVGDGITNDNTLVLSGTASAGNSVKIYDGTTLLGSATANSSGNWTYTTSTLANGKHSFSASATSSSGTSALSKTLAVTVDTVAPAAPAIVSSSPKAGQSSVLTLTGNAEANSKVNVYDGKTLLGSATANGSGAWTLTTAALSTGTHQLTATASDAAGNNSVTSSSFNATIKAPTSTPAVTSVTASGAGILSGTGNLGAGKTVTLAVKLSEAVTVTGGTPTLKLNDGGIATYTGGSGTNVLSFTYKTAAGQNTSDLTVTGVNLGTATVKGSAGGIASLTGAVSNPAGTLRIDTTRPIVTSVAASGSGIAAGSGVVGVGKVVNLTLKLSEAVTVTGGTPTLKLNDGGTATYASGSGSDTLTFKYTVAAGQNTADLAVTAVNSGTATVKDGAGNIANLAAAISNPAGVLQVNTTATATNSPTPSTGSGGSPDSAPHHWQHHFAAFSGAIRTTVASTDTAGQAAKVQDTSAGDTSPMMGSSLDHRLALFAQHIASAFPSSPFAEANTSAVSQGAWKGSELPHLAQPVANQQHGPIAGSL